MTDAIEQIVGTFVRLKNRQKLEEMMLHRQRLALHLQSLSGADVSKPIQQVNDDIAAIEAGLRKVADEPYVATVPRNSWL
jgi:hypothetical protein